MTGKEKLKEIKKLADAMYYAAFNLTTDASLLRKAMKEYHQFIIHEYCKEEPIAPQVLEDMLNAKTAAESLGISQEEHDRIVDELICGKEPELVDVDDLPNKEEEPVSEEIGNYNHTAVLEGLGYQSKEEPISEELEEASKEWLKPQLDKSYADYGETKMMELTHFDGYAMLDAIEFGAKWQKQQIIGKTVKEGFLIDWFIASVDETEPPIWTEEHINELCKDFYVSPK